MIKFLKKTTVNFWSDTFIVIGLVYLFYQYVIMSEPMPIFIVGCLILASTITTMSNILGEIAYILDPNKLVKNKKK